MISLPEQQEQCLKATDWLLTKLVEPISLIRVRILPTVFSELSFSEGFQGALVSTNIKDSEYKMLLKECLLSKSIFYLILGWSYFSHLINAEPVHQEQVV